MNEPNVKNEEKVMRKKVERRDKKNRPTMKVDGGKLKNLQKIIRDKG